MHIGNLYIHFGKMPMPLLIFKIGFLKIFLLLSCRSFLMYFDAGPLSDMRFADILFLSVSLFTFNGIFWNTKIFNFDYGQLKFSFVAV